MISSWGVGIMDRASSANRQVSWGRDLMLTSYSDKQAVMEDLVTHFANGDCYSNLCGRVRSNMAVLSKLRNAVADFVSNTFMFCDVATTMQEALVLLAMNKFGITNPNKVLPEHVVQVVDDLLCDRSDETGRYYSTIVEREVDIVHLRHNGCNVSDGQTALQARLDARQLSEDHIQKAIDHVAGTLNPDLLFGFLYPIRKVGIDNAIDVCNCQLQVMRGESNEKAYEQKTVYLNWKYPPEGMGSRPPDFSILRRWSAKQIENLLKILNEVKLKSEYILSKWKKNAKNSQEITVIVSPGQFGLLDHVQLTEYKGDIKLTTLDGNVVNNSHGAPCNFMGLGNFLQHSKRNMNDLDLSNTHLLGFDFTHGNFARTSFHEHNMVSGNFSYSDLSETTLSLRNTPHVCKPCFHGTNLTGATLEEVPLLYVDINKTTILNHASITLKFPRWSNDQLDRELNHLTNTTSGSVLTKIDSIDEKYQNEKGKVTKIDLMHQVIDSLGDTDTSSVHNAMMDIWAKSSTMTDIWAKSSIYLNDDKIRSYINDKILPSKIARANISPLVVTRQAELQLFLRLVEQQEDKRGEFMLKNNGFFVQLMMLCTEQNIASDIQLRAQKLYAEYLNLGELQAGVQLMDDLGGDPRLIDGLDKQLKTGKDLPAGRCFVFFQQANNTSHILVLDRVQVRAMPISGSADVDCRWGEIGYAWGERAGEENMVMPEKLVVGEAVSQFPLFYTAYLFKQHNAGFKNLLKTMHLSYVNESNEIDVISKDYTPLFEKALLVTRLKVDLTGAADQNTLKKIFSRLFNAAPYPQLNDKVRTKAKTITEEHYTKIIETFGMHNANNLTKARTLFCLAAIFAKYSSSDFFGTDRDSPTALRKYAGALLIKAYELDPSVFGHDENSQKNNFTEWLTRMVGGVEIATGKEAEFTCTAVLSGLLIKHVNTQPEFWKILTLLMPTGWW